MLGNLDIVKSEISFREREREREREKRNINIQKKINVVSIESVKIWEGETKKMIMKL